MPSTKQSIITPSELTPSCIATFRKRILAYYRRNGRDLPWRATTDPYRVLVSEIMLQQTQVDRVIPKYETFITRFPDIAELAAASLKEVLTLWQGLGYNRRAQNLHNCARIVTEKFDGTMPKAREELMALPGIGVYTSAAVSVFAYNKPCVFIETNIRAVYIYTFFPKTGAVSDTQLEPYIQATLSKRNPCRWYNALMDYGVYIKKQHGNPARKSKHHTKQSRFEGSDRQIRGMIIKILGKTETISTQELVRQIGKESGRVQTIIDQLMQEGMVAKNKKRLSLPQN